MLLPLWWHTKGGGESQMGYFLETKRTHIHTESLVVHEKREFKRMERGGLLGGAPPVILMMRYLVTFECCGLPISFEHSNALC